MSWFKRKEPVMPEKEFEIDYDKLGAAVAKAISPAFQPLVDQQKIIADTLTADVEARKTAAKPADAKPADAAKPGEAAKPLTAQDVAQIVADSIKASQTSTEAANSRKVFVADKLKDLPAAYQNQLGADPAKWAAEEQAIRTQYQADFKVSGGKAPEVNGNAGQAGATTPAATVDYSKLTPTQLIAQGLAASTPQGPRAAGVSTATAAK